MPIEIKNRYTSEVIRIIDSLDLRGANLSRADLRDADLGRADLSGANLSRADLSGANLSGAYLSGADLRGAYLSGADLRGADLSGADPRDADLSRADLSGADLSGANLSRAYLSGANLCRANLSGAVLRGAYLSGADLRGADLRGAYLSRADLTGIPPVILARTLIVPQDGDVIGWKQLHGGVICKLLIPDGAKRFNATGRKCRAERAIVLEIIGAEVGYSQHDGTFEYRVGEAVIPRTLFDEDRWNECSSGIHFFITREEAEAY